MKTQYILWTILIHLFAGSVALANCTPIDNICVNDDVYFVNDYQVTPFKVSNVEIASYMSGFEIKSVTYTNQLTGEDMKLPDYIDGIGLANRNFCFKKTGAEEKICVGHEITNPQDRSTLKILAAITKKTLRGRQPTPNWIVKKQNSELAIMPTSRLKAFIKGEFDSKIIILSLPGNASDIHMYASKICRWESSNRLKAQDIAQAIITTSDVKTYENEYCENKLEAFLVNLGVGDTIGEYKCGKKEVIKKMTRLQVECE